MKHLAAVSVPGAWGHLRSLTVFLGGLLQHEPSLHVTLFVPVNHSDRIAALQPAFGVGDRLRIVHVDDITWAGFAPMVLKLHYDDLIAGKPVAGHAALPAPTGIVVDAMSIHVVDHALDTGYTGETMIWSMTNPETLAYMDACSRHALGPKAHSDLFAPKGAMPRYAHEYSVSKEPQFTPDGLVPDVIIELYKSRAKGHRLITGWSRELLPDSVSVIEADARQHGHRAPITVTAPYLASFWDQSAKPTFPDDALFNWLGKQAKQSVVMITFGSMFFPMGDGQLETLVDALIRNKWAFLLMLGSAQVDLLDKQVLERVKEKVVASGNLHTRWIAQELALHHSSIAFVLHHGGAGTLLESTIRGVPSIIWPITADQPLMAHTFAEQLDAGYQLWEGRQQLVGRKVGNRPGFSVTGTLEALASELDYVLTAARGEEGKRKRANTVKVGQLLCKEREERGAAYLKEVIDLL